MALAIYFEEHLASAAAAAAAAGAGAIKQLRRDRQQCNTVVVGRCVVNTFCYCFTHIATD
jgi:hypothetical protein